MAGRDWSPRRQVRGQACGADRAEQRTGAVTEATPWTFPGLAAVLFSGLNGDIQTLWPNVASEAVAPTGPGRPSAPGAGHTSCPWPCGAPPPCLPWEGASLLTPSSSSPFLLCPLFGGLQLRGPAGAWLPHGPSCHVDSGWKPPCFWSALGSGSGGPGRPSPRWTDDSRALWSVGPFTRGSY